MGFNSYNKQTQENMQMLLSFMWHFFVYEIEHVFAPTI